MVKPNKPRTSKVYPPYLVCKGYIYYTDYKRYREQSGISCYLDILDPKMKKRYEKYFWDKWCKFLIPEKYWYGFWYDFLWMTFRYELPAILISLVLGSWFWVSGLLVPCGYAFCWYLNDKGIIKRAIVCSEFISGFVSGLFLI